MGISKSYSCFRIFVSKSITVFIDSENTFSPGLTEEVCLCVCKEGFQIDGCVDHIICSDLLAEK